MTTELTPNKKDDKHVEVKLQNNSSGTLYTLGLIGACIYYFKRATTPQEKARAFFKGLVWPVSLVHDLLVFLHPEE